jgi:hypothetical protein
MPGKPDEWQTSVCVRYSANRMAKQRRQSVPTFIPLILSSLIRSPYTSMKEQIRFQDSPMPAGSHKQRAAGINRSKCFLRESSSGLPCLSEKLPCRQHQRYHIFSCESIRLVQYHYKLFDKNKQLCFLISNNFFYYSSSQHNFFS